jgi:hypothetical protein
MIEQYLENRKEEDEEKETEKPPPGKRTRRLIGCNFLNHR